LIAAVIVHPSKPSILSRRSAGFTLLEVLVVLAIIGGLMSIATFTSSSNPAQEETEQFARQLTVLLEAYREDAVFQNVDFGVAMDLQELMLLSYLDVNSQQVQAMDGKEQAKVAKNPWQPHSSGPLKKELQAPETIEFRLLIEEQEIDFDELLEEDSGPRPALLFLSSDEYTPFVLELNHRQDNSFIVRLRGDGFSPLYTEVERYED